MPPHIMNTYCIFDFMCLIQSHRPPEAPSSRLRASCTSALLRLAFECSCRSSRRPPTTHRSAQNAQRVVTPEIHPRKKGTRTCRKFRTSGESRRFRISQYADGHSRQGGLIAWRGSVAHSTRLTFSSPPLGCTSCFPRSSIAMQVARAVPKSGMPASIRAANTAFSTVASRDPSSDNT